MSKFVQNISHNHWVIIAPSRVTRPHDNTSTNSELLTTNSKCPFCPEQDGLNKELFVIGVKRGPLASQEDLLRNTWLVRVISNKYPITDIHEVIIHSPDHNKDIDELPVSHVELILNTYRARYNYHKKDGKVLIFNNHDIHAGASLKHPHSQLCVIPNNIEIEDIPKEPVSNLVTQSKFFDVYCPDFSQWPYEVWLAPRSPEGEVGVARDFGSITDSQISDLAPLLQKVLKAIVDRFRVGARNDNAVGAGSSRPHVGAIHESPEIDIPYNFYIYHGKDWYLRIIPRMVHRAGLELGTGLTVNIVDPEVAAQEYKNMLL